MKMVDKTPENEKQCICTACPTYTTHCSKQTPKIPSSAMTCPKPENEDLYCAFGETSCFTKESGCICSKCPVHSEYILKSGYFCTRKM